MAILRIMALLCALLGAAVFLCQSPPGTMTAVSASDDFATEVYTTACRHDLVFSTARELVAGVQEQRPAVLRVIAHSGHPGVLQIGQFWIDSKFPADDPELNRLFDGLYGICDVIEFRQYRAGSGEDGVELRRKLEDKLGCRVVLSDDWVGILP